ncbi:hypothetical protein GO986_05280 [Deinococcus sp. HMF7620]|uniref:DUF8082 domain-containing protein n=1 Tax=Deinococcus arboris TaxID=2682977 RepID=A0A7C9I212_9DEIO|nr:MULTISPECIES: hypothetical protein [Deinococcus]MBZ9749281.1 hypothetical protein [Deinococcus betulae]MVN86171.1 hypothetical protein [Deinococcus arboris]
MTLTAPTWPDGLTDQTPLPFNIWRVMTHVDGLRDLTEVARLAGMTVPDAQERLRTAGEWVKRANQNHQQVSDDTADAVTACLTPVVGPMAAVMVDEALDDLGDGATLNALLSHVARQLTPERVQQFARNLRARGLA